MTQIRFETIRNGIRAYEKPICLFFDSLDTELLFLNDPNYDRIWNAEFTILALDNDTIIGLAGTVKYHHIFHLGYVIVKKEYHSRGVGGFLHLRRKAEAKKHCNLLVSWIHTGNKLSVDLNRFNGARYVGTRKGILCLALPLNKKGLILYYILKAAFQIRILLDNLKRFFIN